jgi:uncharacterized phage protein (TIGR02220 family)
MADNKKSFIAYSDWQGMFNALPDEVAGKLIKHIFSYVNDENPSSEDFIINALFEQIKATLKRDLIKWDKERSQRSDAGKKSAESRATKSNERSTEDNERQRNSTVSVSDNEIVNTDKSDVINWTELLKFFNAKTKKNCKVIPTKAKAAFTARLKEGYTKQDFATAIQNCAADEFHINNPHHLTLEFISRQDKLDKYLNVGNKPKTATNNLNPKNLPIIL